MNWSFLHPGIAGVVESGALAFVFGILAFVLWHVVARAARWPEGRALGWACFTALVASSGLDFWYLLGLFFVNPTSPARVQIALGGIHDPEWLGARFVIEAICALLGAVSGWLVAQRGGSSRQA